MNLQPKLSFFIRYLFNPPWDTEITPPELKKFVASHPPGKALELGCGTGTNAIYLAKHGWQVTAVDFAANAIKKAREKARYTDIKINFLIEDVSRLTIANENFDLILDIGCFHGLSEKDRKIYLQNIVRLLDTQGIYLLYSRMRGISGEFGLSISDLEKMQASLEMIERQDGSDQGRPSAWFAWRKPVALF